MSKQTESAAALGFVMHEDERYGQAYERAKSAIGGFPGIWQLAADAAECYEQRVAGHDDATEWIEAIGALAQGLVAYLIEHGAAPAGDALDGIVDAAIAASRQS
jgi:hypothetical protein